MAEEMEIDELEPLNPRSITENFITIIDFNLNRIEDTWDLRRSENSRVISVEKCPSFARALSFIMRPSFRRLFYVHSHLFVIVLKCDESGEFEMENLSDFNAKYDDNWREIGRFKRPVLVIFESENESRVIYKPYGVDEQFKEFHRNQIPTSLFQSLFTNLNGDHFLTSTMSVTQEEVNRTVGTLEPDFLAIRFIHLYDAALRPSERFLDECLKWDYRHEDLNRFTTIFDYNFVESPDDAIAGSLAEAYDHLTVDDRLFLVHHSCDFSNMLMHMVNCNNVLGVKLCIRCGIDVNTRSLLDARLAADIACDKRRYEILFELLSANSLLPENLNKCKPMDMPPHLRQLINDSLDLYVLLSRISTLQPGDKTGIKEQLTEKFTQIIDSHPNLRHFYGPAKDSIATMAIRMHNFDAYVLLLQRNVYIGPYESVEETWSRLNEEQREELRAIQIEHSIELPETHVSILVANSSACHDNTIAITELLTLITFAFNFLNAIAFIKPLLKVVAASRVFRIVFDFNRDSIEYANPTVNRTVKANFHLNGFHIYIGAAHLLRESTREIALAALAHELCHCAMQLIYGNVCKPYDINEADKKERRRRFEGIFAKYTSGEIAERGVMNDIIALVFNYNEEVQHAELIVRVPHLIALNHNDIVMDEIIERNIELFAYYNEVVLPDLLERQPKVEQNFNLRMSFAHGIIAKRQRVERLKTIGLWLLASMALLAVGALIFTVFVVFEPCHWRDDCRFFDYRPGSEREILDYEIFFQNKTTTLRELTGEDPKLLNALTPYEVRNMQNAHFAAVSSSKRLFPRHFLEFDATCWDLDEFFDPEPQFDIASVRAEANGGAVLVTCKDINNKSRMPRGEPVCGLTSAMRLVFEHLKAACELCYVIFTDLSEIPPEKFNESKIHDRESLVNFLVSNEFLRALLKKQLESGKAKLIIDGLDDLYYLNRALAADFVRVLNSNTSVETWMTTRLTHTVEDFRGNLRVLQLLPLLKENRTNFFTFIAREMNTIATTHKINTFDSFIGKLEQWRGMSDQLITNIFLLERIAEDIIKHNSIDVNLFSALDAYIGRILQRKFISLDATTKEGHETNLIKITLSSYKNVSHFLALNMTSLWNRLPPRAINSSSMDAKNPLIARYLRSGIVRDDGKGHVTLMHPLFFEYFVALFLKHVIHEKGKDETFNEMIFKDEILFVLNTARDSQHEFVMVKEILASFVKSGEGGGKFSGKFKAVLKESLKDFMRADAESKDFKRTLKNLFGNDEEIMAIIEQE